MQIDQSKDSRVYVPVMSATAVKTITDCFLKRKKIAHEYYVIEYGSGNSTKFFIDFLESNNGKVKYIAVERLPWWYKKMLLLFPGGFLKKNMWSLRDYFRFINAKAHNAWSIPKECSRLLKQQKRMAKLKYFLKFLFSRRNFWFDANYKLDIGEIDFEYQYIFEGFKDQYGESPHKYKYIKLPLQGLVSKLKSGVKCHAIFIIDGGPRADIISETFNLIDKYSNLSVDIFLLEAYRGFYERILASRSGGVFIGALQNKMINGEQYLEDTFEYSNMKGACAGLLSAPSLNHALAYELWYFTNVKK